MSTLFQLHAPMNTLKAMVREMAPLWHSGDSILLLAETVAALPWLKTYIDDINYDDELLSQITDIDTIYILNDDLAQLNEQARANLDLSQVSVINDMQWVHLTQSVDRVITLNSLS
ncbi:hypothetical protein [Psychrobacter phenylpyruvicus]|uniref:Uncharacterized protein n=1 Tax=Psychrobacter phenylpyruvicus TaxID=29432 RepID=A0A379LMN5_9GAMM|nr:hypothetical protein [Psychrobacter phenylpyruvicus]SUD91034.1 Uncharacterised protein [Psychrobacter phenylpyruvicus]